MSVSKYLEYKIEGEKDILQLKSEEVHLLPRRVAEIVNGDISEINFLLRSCTIINSFRELKQRQQINADIELKNVKECKDFKNLFTVMQDQYGKFGFSNSDLEILTYTQLEYDRRGPWTIRSAPEQPRPTPAPRSTVERRVPTRRAPSPPSSPSIPAAPTLGLDGILKTGARPRTTSPPIKQKEPCEDELVIDTDALKMPPPKWTPPPPPPPKIVTKKLTRPNHPPPPPPPQLPPSPPPPPYSPTILSPSPPLSLAPPVGGAAARMWESWDAHALSAAPLSRRTTSPPTVPPKPPRQHAGGSMEVDFYPSTE